MNEATRKRLQLGGWVGTTVVLLLLGVADMNERNERREMAAEIDKM